MASKTYHVPVDFSKGSEIALDHAVKMAKENRGKLLLLHVISTNFPYPMDADYGNIFDILEKDARDDMRALVRRKRLKPGRCRFVLITGISPAEVIAGLARKSRVSMIVMGSHGRTGFQRFVLGSVAERTLRHAHCPVLIVKK